MPLYFADHVAQYFDEIVDYSAVGVRLAEVDLESLPAAVDAAVQRIEALQTEVVCACQATITPLGLSADTHFQELRTRREFTQAVDRFGAFATLMVRLERRESCAGPGGRLCSPALSDAVTRPMLFSQAHPAIYPTAHSDSSVLRAPAGAAAGAA